MVTAIPCANEGKREKTAPEVYASPMPAMTPGGRFSPSALAVTQAMAPSFKFEFKWTLYFRMNLHAYCTAFCADSEYRNHFLCKWRIVMQKLEKQLHSWSGVTREYPALTLPSLPIERGEAVRRKVMSTHVRSRFPIGIAGLNPSKSSYWKRGK